MRLRTKNTYMINTTTRTTYLQLEDIEDPCGNRLITVAVENLRSEQSEPWRNTTLAYEGPSMAHNNKGNCNTPSSQFHHYGTKVETPARS